MPQPTGPLAPETLARLQEAARDVVRNSYSPYSGFPVGAAILTGAGTIHAGTNVENASYGLSLCAERAAMLQAIAEGHRDPVALVLYTRTPAPSTPCGACLQFLAEFNPALPILCVAENDTVREHSLDQLLSSVFRLGPR